MRLTDESYAEDLLSMQEEKNHDTKDIIDKDTNVPITDCISRQPEKEEFIKLTVRNSNGRPYYSIIYLVFDDNGVGHDLEGYSSYSLDVISDYLKKYFMPSAQPERMRGKWIDGGSYADGHGAHDFRCSECGGHIIEYYADPFCRWCGADMRGEQDE